MRQKELRIALVCYGGISLAVYMHGVTKELWKLARASRAAHDGLLPEGSSEAVYAAMLRSIAQQRQLRLRVLVDVVAGASAGGINGVFLAQAIHSGQSLEPLTRLWLERADVDVLLDPDARLWSRFLKYWAVPVVRFLLTRPGNMVSASVARETRAEVRAKLSRLVRSRWFEAPFGGIGFSRLLAEALDAMAHSLDGDALLPPGHPLDLFVTTTDFRGHLARMRLHSPPEVSETEHRLTIGFSTPTPRDAGIPLAPLPELVCAARATASFPGAFPALSLGEIDALMAERGEAWPAREDFLRRVLPPGPDGEPRRDFALIDGSVLVNAPFAEAMRVLSARPAQREVDRRLVYIDPRPEPAAEMKGRPGLPGFFPILFGALSTIPREQPIRDNLETLEAQSREMVRMQAVVAALRPAVEAAVEHLFGHTLFLDHPSVRRLETWRDRAQTAAAEEAGYAYHSYARLKITGVIAALARLVAKAVPGLGEEHAEEIITAHAAALGLADAAPRKGGLTDAAIAFLREHDLAHRIRRLRFLARRLAGEWQPMAGVSEDERQAARDAVYSALALYFEREHAVPTGPAFASIAAELARNPGAVLAEIARRRQLPATDSVVDGILSAAMVHMPRPLRRLVLLTYLGFPFYDTATLPLLRAEGLTEYEPVKIDRISPEDAGAIRSGGAQACLKGLEFYNFGAFFSRAYRENDYLWGRLHGAERMVDLLASTLEEEDRLEPDAIAHWKRQAFLAILAEEDGRLRADPGLVSGIRAEVERGQTG